MISSSASSLSTPSFCRSVASLSPIYESHAEEDDYEEIDVTNIDTTSSPKSKSVSNFSTPSYDSSVISDSKYTLANIITSSEKGAKPVVETTNQAILSPTPLKHKSRPLKAIEVNLYNDIESIFIPTNQPIEGSDGKSPQNSILEEKSLNGSEVKECLSYVDIYDPIGKVEEDIHGGIQANDDAKDLFIIGKNLFIDEEDKDPIVLNSTLHVPQLSTFENQFNSRCFVQNSKAVGLILILIWFVWMFLNAPGFDRAMNTNHHPLHTTTTSSRSQTVNHKMDKLKRIEYNLHHQYRLLQSSSSSPSFNQLPINTIISPIQSTFEFGKYLIKSHQFYLSYQLKLHVHRIKLVFQKLIHWFQCIPNGIRNVFKPRRLVV